MVVDLGGKLACLSELNLQALAGQVANMLGGKDRVRVPIATKILGWAAEAESPTDDASRLFWAVFGWLVPTPRQISLAAWTGPWPSLFWVVSLGAKRSFAPIWV